jgi:hypothetical protein
MSVMHEQGVCVCVCVCESHQIVSHRVVGEFEETCNYSLVISGYHRYHEWSHAWLQSSGRV